MVEPLRNRRDESLIGKMLRTFCIHSRARARTPARAHLRTSAPPSRSTPRACVCARTRTTTIAHARASNGHFASSGVRRVRGRRLIRRRVLIFFLFAAGLWHTRFSTLRRRTRRHVFQSKRTTMVVRKTNNDYCFYDKNATTIVLQSSDDGPLFVRLQRQQCL